MPKGFTLDSTITFDSARNAEIQIIIPKSQGETLFDKQVSAYIKQRVKSYRLSLDTLIQNEPSMLQAVQSSFYVAPVSVFKDDKMVSYCFIISSDHAGAAHPFTEYYSFNYNLKRNKQFAFSDYFNVHSKQATQSFISIVNKAIDRPNIGVDKLDDIDFNIEKDSIAFNFDDYEVGSYADGIIKAKVAKQALKQFMTSNNH
ncbi:MAG: RsiV family protein [Flavisolibacter sp.]